MDTELNVQQGSFHLQRLPQRKNETLRAWDAADEYLLDYVSEHIPLEKDATKILIINDSFGALTVALAQFKTTAISDSFISQQATRFNLENNDISLASDCLKNTLDWSVDPVDLVLIKVPKTMAFFEDQLIRLQALLTENTIVIAAGMVKSMPKTVWKLMEQYLGPTTPSLAKKKARLIFTDLNKTDENKESPYPIYYQLENTKYQICNHANVFSRDSLDIGTRFLLQHLPQNANAQNIVDLGCGNGIVGLMLAETHPQAVLHFVDESYMAVASAQENFQHAFTEREANFCVTDGLTEFKDETMDLIVCNPPFHQQSTVGNQVALSLFKDSKRVLKKGGEFWVIGNRHLGYHINLKSTFGNCQEVASNKKFVIWKVLK